MVLYLVPTVSIGGLISLFDDPNILHAGKAVVSALSCARTETEQLRCSYKGSVSHIFRGAVLDTAALGPLLKAYA